MESANYHRGLSAFVRSTTSVAVNRAIGSTNMPPWRLAMDYHLSRLTTEQLTQISCPTSPEDLLQMLKSVYKGARSKKTAKFLGFLSTYTQPLQQFQQAIDVVVGTCAGIGSPIWAPMKVVLKLLEKNAKAYDIFAGHLTLLALKLPIYEKYSQLFPSSEDLRNALAFIYMDYLDFCVRAINYFSVNGVANLLRAIGRPFEDEFGEVLASMESNLTKVEDAVKAAAFSEQVSTHEALRREKVLRWLSPSVFDSELREFRNNWVPGTCEWINHTDEYEKWSGQRGLNQPHLLWIPWHAGYGKSFIAHYVRQTLLGSPGIVLFFFFNSKQENSGKRTAIAFLRTILYQLLTTLHDSKLLETCFSILYGVVEKSGHHEARSTEEIWGAAARIFAQTPMLHLVIDALDECNPAERIEVLDRLASITQSAKTFKVAITSRPDIDIRKYFDKMPVDGFIELRFSKQYVHKDLMKYVTSRLQKSEIFMDNEKLKKEVKEKILHRADGMFLYVRLMIDELELETTVGDVRKRLRNLPKNLAHYYSTVLLAIKRSSTSRCQLARDIFLWAITAYRPLKLSELISALEIQRKSSPLVGGTEDGSWPLLGDPRKQIRDICFPLIEILEDQTVQVIHTSVTQYLLNQKINDNSIGPISVQPFDFGISTAHSEVACVTLRSLLFASERDHIDIAQQDNRIGTGNDTNSGKESSNGQTDLSCIDGFHSYCVLFWNRHIIEASGNFRESHRIFLDFFQKEEAFTNWIQARCRLDFRFKLYFRLQSTQAGYETAQTRPSPLHIASYFNLFEFMDELVMGGFSLEVQDGSGASPLHIAAEQGFDKLVQWLLKAGADHQARDKNGKTALHRAASKGHISSVLHLSGPGLDCKDKFGRSALSLASRYGNELVVQKLLENGAEAVLHSVSGESPLSVAVVNGHLEVVRLLLAKGCHVLDRQGLCHVIAARKGFLHIVELLFGSVDWNAKDDEGRMALHHAVSEGHVDVVELLLQGADINMSGLHGQTLLHDAAKGGHAVVVELLLRAGANINTSGTYGRTPLHDAAKGGHVTVVELLLRAGANINTSEIYGRTPLHDAAEGGYVAVIELLLKAGANINANEIHGQTPLHDAAKGGHAVVVELLLRAGANINTNEIHGQTPLHDAAKGGHAAVVELLLQAGADINASGLLRVAEEGGYAAVVGLLLKTGTGINTSEIYGWTPLHDAAKGGHVAVVELLLGAGADINASGLLRAAEEGGYAAVVGLLQRAGAEINASRSGGNTPLQISDLGGHLDLVELLTEADTSASLKTLLKRHAGVVELLPQGCAGVDTSVLRSGATQQGDLSLGEMLLIGDNRSLPNEDTTLQETRDGHVLAVAELLSRAGADIDASSINFKETAFHWAAQHGHMEVAELLLQAGVDVNAQSYDFQLMESTALHGAAQHGHTVVVELLLRNSANINAKTSAGETALDVAASKGHTGVVELLLEAGAKLNVKRTSDQEAAKGEHEAVVELSNDCEANMSAQVGTALCKAASGGHEAMVELLLGAGFDANAESSLGKYALHKAAEGGHEGVVKLLLEAGCEMNVRTDFGDTALHKAAEGGHEGVVRLLLKAGCEMNMTAHWGYIALHKAAEGGHEGVVKLLLEAGCEMNLWTDFGDTALHKAVEGGHEAVVKLLLEAGCEMNVKTYFGNSALHKAVEGGHEAVLELLLSAGVDVNALNGGKKIALHIAVLIGNSSGIKPLLEAGSMLDALDNENNTPLHLASSRGFLDIVEELLEAGADHTIRNKEGKTPADLAEQTEILAAFL